MPNEFDSVELVFSVAEKTSYLQEHGYKIDRKVIDSDKPLHGGIFLPFLSIEFRATKDDMSGDVHEIFESLLKDKLLML